MKTMLRRIILTVMALVLLLSHAAAAEAAEPMYATIGDALAAAGENPVAGGEDGYFAVITEKDGTYYRSVAETDDRYAELLQATYDTKPEDMDAAFDALDEYTKTLPVSYTEAFTVSPMTQEEMDALVGKTVGELREMGYQDYMSGTDADENDEMIITYVMTNGLFAYRFVVDADFDAYENAQDNGDAFVIKAVNLYGISSDAYSKRYHTDGTMEETEDPFDSFSGFSTDMLEMIQKYQNGEEVDIGAFLNEMAEKYPDLAEFVNTYIGMYELLGAEQFMNMMNSTDGDTGDASHGEETDDTGDYMIDEAFNGTTWQSGELTMHIVWQDGYYKAVVMENGVEKWVYLCEYGDYIDEAAEAMFSCLTGIGTGDEELTETQEDHGETTILYDWRSNEIIWKKADGTEMIFTAAVSQ